MGHLYHTPFPQAQDPRWRGGRKNVKSTGNGHPPWGRICPAMSRSLHTWTPSDYDCTHKMYNILSPPNSQHGCGKGIWSPTPSEKLLATDGYCRRKSQFSSGMWAPGGHPDPTDGPTLNAHRHHWVFPGSFRRKTTWSCKGKVVVVGRKKGGVDLIKTHMNAWSSHTIKS